VSHYLTELMVGGSYDPVNVVARVARSCQRQ